MVGGIMIELFFYFVCTLSECHTERLHITPAAMAVASCESGDGWRFGTVDFTARSITNDGGAWQFNDATALWIAGRDHAETWEPATQYAAFVQLWDNGRGWRHWTASRPCWERWLTIDETGAAVWNPNAAP